MGNLRIKEFHIANCIITLTRDGTTIGTVLSQIKAQSGQWYHVAFGRGRGASKDRRLFINGREEGAGEVEDDFASRVKEPGYVEGICLGAVYASVKSGDADVTSFKGAIGEIAVYNRFLNAHEVQKLYKAGFPR